MDTYSLLILTAVAVILLSESLQLVMGGQHSEDQERLRRFRMYKFKYDYSTVKKWSKSLKNKTTTARIHFFRTTKSANLDSFRACPVCMDEGNGSFFNQRMAELHEQRKEIIDKSYILKELGDRLAPSGRTHSKSLYLTGYRFLEDERNIDMIVKFFDVEVDSDGNELPEHKKVNKKLFAGGKILVNNTEAKLKPLFVSETYLWDYQGTLPCVVLNFNNFKGTSYESIRQEIAAEIRNIFHKFKYLFQPNTLSKRTQNSYDIYSNGDVTHDELYNAVLFIMRTIYRKYRRQIIFILNDGKDTIIVNFKSSVGYVLSDNFTNLRLQLLHRYANIVRRNLKLNGSHAFVESNEETLYGNRNSYKLSTGKKIFDRMFDLGKNKKGLKKMNLGALRHSVEEYWRNPDMPDLLNVVKDAWF